MKQPTFYGKELLPLSVIEAARAGDPLAAERILRHYDGYINRLCSRTIYDKDGIDLAVVKQLKEVERKRIRK